MSTNHETTGKDENLKLENDFLKMKLMLEQGAQFGGIESAGECPAEIENQFLRNIIEFEKQFAVQKKIKVFERIGKPVHFRPVNDIAADEIDDAWKELAEYLCRFSIDLTVCSPNISVKELYRFTVEELFQYEMDDMNIPGMMHCFTYDEFHPDHEYENTRVALDKCMRQIFSKKKFEEMCHFKSTDLRLNDRFPLTEDEFKILVNRFHEAYEDIELDDISDYYFCIDDKSCKVKGSYSMIGKLSADETILKGNWLVEFKPDEECYYWYITNVQIEGIEF